jgi:hypothetical protein
LLGFTLLVAIGPAVSNNGGASHFGVIRRRTLQCHDGCREAPAFKTRPVVVDAETITTVVGLDDIRDIVMPVTLSEVARAGAQKVLRRARNPLIPLSAELAGFAAKPLSLLGKGELPKLNVVGSIPIARSKLSQGIVVLARLALTPSS